MTGRKIHIAGHRGMVGPPILRRLQTADYTDLVTLTYQKLDLLDYQAVFDFPQTEKPDCIPLAKAKAGIKDLCFLGSSLIYLRDCRRPIKEAYLLTGPPAQTNEPCAIAKKYRRQ